MAGRVGALAEARGGWSWVGLAGRAGTGFAGWPCLGLLAARVLVGFSGVGWVGPVGGALGPFGPGFCALGSLAAGSLRLGGLPVPFGFGFWFPVGGLWAGVVWFGVPVVLALPWHFASGHARASAWWLAGGPPSSRVCPPLSHYPIFFIICTDFVACLVANAPRLRRVVGGG